MTVITARQAQTVLCRGAEIRKLVNLQTCVTSDFDRASVEPEPLGRWDTGWLALCWLPLHGASLLKNGTPSRSLLLFLFLLFRRRAVACRSLHVQDGVTRLGLAPLPVSCRVHNDARVRTRPCADHCTRTLVVVGKPACSFCREIVGLLSRCSAHVRSQHVVRWGRCLHRDSPLSLGALAENRWGRACERALVASPSSMPRKRRCRPVLRSRHSHPTRMPCRMSIATSSACCCSHDAGRARVRVMCAL